MVYWVRCPFSGEHGLAHCLCFQQNDPEGSKGGELCIRGFFTYPHQFKSFWDKNEPLQQHYIGFFKPMLIAAGKYV